MNNNSIRVAMIGFGGIAKSHKRGYENLVKQGAPVQLIAICDINPEQFTKAQALADHQLFAAFLGSSDHFLTICGGKCHRLFAQNVLAGTEHLDGIFLVEEGRQADVNHIEGLLGDHLVKVGV